MRLRPLNCSPLFLLLLVTPAAGSAQEAAPPQGAVLKPADHEMLGKKLQAWFEAEDDLNELDNAKKRDPAAKKRVNDARMKLKKAFWDEAEKKAKEAKLDTVLRSVPDLKAIFGYAFKYENRNGGLIQDKKVQVDKEVLTGVIYAPKTYAPKNAYPLILTLPSRTADEKNWVESKKHLESTWSKAALLEQAVFFCPTFPKDLHLDTAFTPSKKEDQNEEDERIRWVLQPMGEIYNEYHLNQDRVVLECSRQSCLFGLRLATYFPDRFAGLVFRDPCDLSSVLPENVRDLPIYILTSGNSEKHAQALAEKLKGLGSTTVTVAKGQGEYPFAADSDAVGKWVLEQQRNLFRNEVVIVPTEIRFKKAYWAQIDKCENSLEGPDRPRLHAKVDREQNRVTVTTKGVEQFSLKINDLLLDLDKKKPITVLVNNEVVWQGTKDRSGEDLYKLIRLKNDPNWIFVREISGLEVKTPKNDKEKDGGKTGEGGGK